MSSRRPGSPGSQLTNKYAEGYPVKRYYGGCEFVDVAEQLAIDRLKKLYGAPYVNVQPHSGSQANQAVYFSMLKPGDTILGMSLAHGGHLTHGASVNLSGKLFNAVSYGLDPATELLDYDGVAKAAQESICAAKVAPAGERWASEALFHRYVRTVNRLAFRLMGRDVDVDDLVQESFAQALRASAGSRSRGRSEHGCRRSSRAPRTRRSGGDSCSGASACSGAKSRSTPTRYRTRRPPGLAFELRAVYGAIHRLPADLRVPLVLHRVEGMQLDEVARMTGTSLATVKRRIAQAERALEPAGPRALPRRGP